MSKHCKRCNAEIDDTIVFCPYAVMQMLQKAITTTVKPITDYA